jgi:hypothetical protein
LPVQVFRRARDAAENPEAATGYFIVIDKAF